MMYVCIALHISIELYTRLQMLVIETLYCSKPMTFEG